MLVNQIAILVLQHAKERKNQDEPRRTYCDDKISDWGLESFCEHAIPSKLDINSQDPSWTQRMCRCTTSSLTVCFMA